MPCFTVSVGLLRPSVHEKYATLSREFSPNGSVARFTSHVSQLLASAYITRSVCVHKMVPPQVLRRVRCLSDLVFNMNWFIQLLFKELNQGHF